MNPSPTQELTRSPSAVTRNNILVALADMVTHFTAMGDCHVPRLAACVVDPHPLVRTQVRPVRGSTKTKCAPPRPHGLLSSRLEAGVLSAVTGWV